MPLYTKSGSLLMRNNKLAISQVCCCNDPLGCCNYPPTLHVSLSTTSFGGIALNNELMRLNSPLIFGGNVLSDAWVGETFVPNLGPAVMICTSGGFLILGFLLLPFGGPTTGFFTAAKIYNCDPFFAFGNFDPTSIMQVTP